MPNSEKNHFSSFINFGFICHYKIDLKLTMNELGELHQKVLTINHLHIVLSRTISNTPNI